MKKVQEGWDKDVIQRRMGCFESGDAGSGAAHRIFCRVSLEACAGSDRNPGGFQQYGRITAESKQ